MNFKINSFNPKALVLVVDDANFISIFGFIPKGRLSQTTKKKANRKSLTK